MVRQSVQALKNTIKIWSVPVSNIRVRKHLSLHVKVGQKLKSAGLPLHTFFRNNGGAVIWGVCTYSDKYGMDESDI